MASFSSTYPAQRPVFTLDAANAGRLDSRMTFTRSDTPPTYAAPSAVHFWSNEKHLSSENLVLQSSSYNTTWSELRLDLTGSQTDPSGGTGAWKLAQQSGQTNAGEIYQYVNVTAARHVLSFYAKAGTNRNFIQLTEALGNGTAKYSYINLSTGAAATVDPSHSFTVTAVGSTGWYRISVPLTPNLARSAYIKFKPIESDASVTVTDNQGFIYLWGVQLEQLDANGPTPINQTTTQIHRAYAPTLKSVATAGQPRFEYDPASDGQSMGILIEGSATNLLNRSEEFDNAYWSKGRTTVQPNAAVSPAGDLTADLITANATGASETHYAAKVFSFTSGTTYTLSVYAKAAGLTQLTLQAGNTATWDASVQFTLTGDGSTSVSSGSAAIERCGNGWYRCSITGDAAASASTNVLFKLVSGGSDSFDGDDYSGALLWGAQLETGAASSYIKVEGSTATRASESLSVATADIGYTGGPVSIVAEGEGGRGDYPRLFSMGDSSSYLTFFRLSSAASASTAYKFWVNDSGVRQADLNEEASVTRVAVSVDTDSVKSCGNGGAVQSDTAAVMPVLSTTLQIGDQPTGGKQWNGHIKRLAIYSEPLSSTNLQALTS